MNPNSLRQTTQEPLNEDERELMHPDTWDWEKTEVGYTHGTPGAIIEVRFTRDEMLDLQRIAQEAGIGPVEYTRQTMIRHIADFKGAAAPKQKRLA